MQKCWLKEIESDNEFNKLSSEERRRASQYESWMDKPRNPRYSAPQWHPDEDKELHKLGVVSAKNNLGLSSWTKLKDLKMKKSSRIPAYKKKSVESEARQLVKTLLQEISSMDDENWTPPPNPPGYQEPPEQCYCCGKYNTEGEIWQMITVDLDPGDPEVGPDPDIQDVAICFDCEKSEDRTPFWEKHRNESLVRERIPENSDFNLRPMGQSDLTTFQGVEGENPLIGEVGDWIVLVGEHEIHVLVGDGTYNSKEYAFQTPYNQGKAIAQEVGRMTDEKELIDYGFVRI
jgi:hypothetical protein